MPERSVVVRLKADIAGFSAAMAKASLDTRAFAAEASKAAGTHKESWDKVGKGMLVTGGIVAAGVGMAIKAAAEFDAGMSVVKANIDDKTAPSMKRLADAALNAGKTTVFSATEAATAENELAKAGLKAAEITGGALAGALSLASAGQLGLGQAAEIAASAMVQFHLSAKDVPHIADLLAAGADKALGGVGDLAESLKYSGVVAHQFGISIEETVGTLAMFAMNGIQGSMAGTGFREMLVMLVKPTAAGSAALKEYNIHAFNTQGHFVGMAGLAEQLKTKLFKLSDQQRQSTLVTLFGVRALAEANILYGAGADGVHKWTTAVNDQGFAALQASTKMDNLNGDLTKLKNTLNVALIEGGKGSQGALRALTQDLTGVVSGFADIPGPVKDSMLALAGVTAAALLLGGTVVMAETRIVSMKAALVGMGVEGNRATGMLKGFAGAVGIAAVAIPLLNQAADAVSGAFGQMAPGSNEAGRALLDFATKGKASGDAANLINDQFGDLGNTVNNVFNSGMGHKINAFFSEWSPGAIVGLESSQTSKSIEFFKTLDTGMAAMVASGHGAEAAKLFNRVADAAKKQGVEISKVTDVFPQYGAAATGMAKGGEAAANSVDGVAKAAKSASDVSLLMTGHLDTAGSALLVMGEGAKAADAAVKALTKSIQADMDAASKAFMADTNVLGKYDPAKHVDAVKAAQDALNKAQAAAGAASVKSGPRGNSVAEQQQVAHAEQAILDATGVHAGNLGKAKQKLSDLEARLADRHKTTVAQGASVDKSNSAVQDAQAALDKARQEQVAASLTNSYKTQINAGNKFVADISAVTTRGLDPNVVARLLQEGPAKAAPALQAMLGGNSATMIKMVNASETALAAINARVMEQSRLTSMAINSNNDQMTSDFSKAMAIDNAKATSGGKATVQSLAKELNIGAGDVRRIAAEFGIGISDGITGGVDPSKKKIDELQAKIDSIRQGKVPGINANSKAAQTVIADLQSQIDGLRGKNIVVTTTLFGASKAQQDMARNMAPPGRAGGGLLSGPGTGTSDSIMGVDASGRHIADVSTGEFVTNAAQTAKNLPLLMAINSGAQGFAGGGLAGINVSLPLASAIQAALNAAPPMGGGGGGSFTGMAGSGVQRWLPLVLQALGLTGQPASMAQTLLRRMNQESGGNPTIVNHWDSNAMAGHPSGGLMQTIASTFNAYRMPGLSSNMFDPLSNIVASIRYALSRYGSLSSAYNRTGGYADGTDNASPGWHMVGENGPEMRLFNGGEKVIPNHHLAKGGLVQNFATGGFVSADFSGITGRISTTPPTIDNLTAARLSQAKATTAVHAAENALNTLRRSAHHTAAQVSLDVQRLTNARGSLAATTAALHREEAAYAAATSPYAAQFHTSAGRTNTDTANFLRHIDLLNKGGYHVLANQLLTAGDANAYTLAAAAVSSGKNARALTADLTQSASLQAGLATRQGAIGQAGTLTTYAATAAGTVRDTAKFYANLTTLSNRGFNPLAAKLLNQGDAEAETVAAQAAKASNAVAAGLNGSITSATAQEAARVALAAKFAGTVPAKDAINDVFLNARYVAGYGMVGGRTGSGAGPTDTGASPPVSAVNFYGNVGWSPDQVARQIVARQQDAASLHNLAGV